MGEQAIHPRYLKCNSCYGRWRVELLTPSVQRSLPTFCPACGANSVVEIDRNQDYWYILAEGMLGKGNARSVALIKGLYDLWQPEIEPHFSVFVQQTMKEHTNGS